jgi:hypothetical protein
LHGKSHLSPTPVTNEKKHPFFGGDVDKWMGGRLSVARMNGALIVAKCAERCSRAMMECAWIGLITGRAREGCGAVGMSLTSAG